MKHMISDLKMLVPVVVMSLVILAPAAAPIITPYPIVRISLACRGQTFGSVSVIDAQGQTHNQVCNSATPVTFGYPMLFPAASAPWRVSVSARSMDRPTGHPRPCLFSITTLPIRLRCVANSEGQFAVDLDISPINRPGPF